MKTHEIVFSRQANENSDTAPSPLCPVEAAKNLDLTATQVCCLNWDDIYEVINQNFPNTVVLLTSTNPRYITSLARLCDNFLAKPYDISTLTYYLDQLDKRRML